MIDFARITVKAGKGGAGAGSFTHIKGKRRGKADGGDGGDGGNVLISATRDLNTLEKYRYVKDYQAKNGQMGTSNLRKGAVGEDLVLKVPVGTQLSVLGSQLSVEGQSVGQLTGQPKTDNRISYDLVEHNQQVLISRGGKGGRGNAHLKDEFGRRPLRGETGGEGETQNLTLELKLIADVGLIGLPNAGKSTLLAALTAAKPQIASYPFTTLEPNLGVLRVESQSRKSKSLSTSHFDYTLVLADIPGLIEGASQGKGLGDLFLRHIERTKMLLHLIDISGGDQEAIWKDYQTIRNELKAYSKELAKKKEIVVLNKIDLIENDILENIQKIFTGKRKSTVAISALGKKGLENLIKSIDKLLKIKP